MRILFVASIALATMLIVGVVTAFAVVLHIVQDAPTIDSFHQSLVTGSSQVFAANGTRLGFIQSDVLSTPASWNEIPAKLKNATVAIEDQRFYHNDGIDLTGIFRAAVKDVTQGAALQGGSTITMQLMRNLYLGNDQHTFRQKITEAKLAVEYTKRHSKRSILTSYLNSIPYGTIGGQTAIGVQAAARVFFDEPVSRLNLQQAALLAGLPQAPSQYNPFRSPAWPGSGETSCSRRWPNCTTSPRRRRPPPSMRAWKCTSATSTHSGARTSSSNTCANSSNTATARRWWARVG